MFKKIIFVVVAIIAVIFLIGFVALGAYGIMNNPDIPKPLKFFLLFD